MLEDCDLHDLGYMGDPFTWINHNHVPASYTRERLDRVVSNNIWRSKFPLVRVFNGDPRHFDHRPVIMDVEERDDRNFFVSTCAYVKFFLREVWCVLYGVSSPSSLL